MKMGFLKHVAVSLVVSLIAIGSGGAVSAQYETPNDNRFRPNFRGTLGPEPYSLDDRLLPVRSRITCDEGRAIVDVRGYYSVRTIECRGDKYTYLGHRHGDSFKVMVSARTGRIVDVDRV